MSRLTNALSNDFTALCFLRDDLALQITLMQSDLKDRWIDLEDKMDRLREQLGRSEVAAVHSAKGVEASSKALVESLRSGYQDISRALKS